MAQSFTLMSPRDTKMHQDVIGSGSSSDGILCQMHLRDIVTFSYTDNSNTISFSTTTKITTHLIGTNRKCIKTCPICHYNNTLNSDSSEYVFNFKESNVKTVVENIWNHCVESHCDVYAFSITRTEKEKDNSIMYHICGIQHNEPQSVDHSTTEQLLKMDNVLRTKIFQPKRPYYHLGTFEKIQDIEYIMDIDCEEDKIIDQQWQQDVSDAEFDDYIDVNDIELHVCTTWNRFIQSKQSTKGYILRAELPCYILEFGKYFVDHHINRIVNEVYNHRQNAEIINITNNQYDSNNFTDTTSSIVSASSSSVENNHILQQKGAAFDAPCNRTQLKQLVKENFVLFLLSRWDENEINRTQLEYMVNCFYELVTLSQPDEEEQEEVLMFRRIGTLL